MFVKRDVLRADGYSEPEIDAIDQYCERAYRDGYFDRTATPVWSNGQGRMVLVCRTVAEAAAAVELAR